MLQPLHVHLLRSHCIWDENSCHLQPHTQSNNNMHGSFYEYQHTECLANKYGIGFEQSFRQLSVYNDSWWPKKFYLYTATMVPRVQFSSINCCTCIISSQLWAFTMSVMNYCKVQYQGTCPCCKLHHGGNHPTRHYLVSPLPSKSYRF